MKESTVKIIKLQSLPTSKFEKKLDRILNECRCNKKTCKECNPVRLKI